MPKLTFVAGARYAAWRDLDAWNESDIDRNAARFRSGIDVWIVQTYLHVRDVLAAEGWKVALSDRFEPGAICVAHWDELHRLRWRAALAYLIGIRADRPPLCVADKVVRQNTLVPDDAATIGIAPWPQPGMRGRRAERGDRVQRIGYFGRMAQAPAFFSDPAFLAEVAALGLEFVPSEHDWQDYRDIDVVIAFRTAPPAQLRHKPVSKVANAWLAGVPAIVGPEPAYLQLRRDELDMCVAHDAPGVIASLSRLVREPGFYPGDAPAGAGAGAGVRRPGASAAMAGLLPRAGRPGVRAVAGARRLAAAALPLVPRPARLAEDRRQALPRAGARRAGGDGQARFGRRRGAGDDGREDSDARAAAPEIGVERRVVVHLELAVDAPERAPGGRLVEQAVVAGGRGRRVAARGARPSARTRHGARRWRSGPLRRAPCGAA